MNPKEYIEDVSQEMRKVNWPDQQELISNTIITLVATAFISTFIYFSDQIITGILDFILA